MKPRTPKSAARVTKTQDDGAAVPKGSFPIVAIGASAGGLEAFTEFFRGHPPEEEMAYVLVQHLDPTHPSLLAEILSKSSRMPVEEVRSGTKLKAGCVYVIPPNALMELEGGAFRLMPRVNGKPQQLAINCFMKSLAEQCKSRAIGVVLSGTGADGTTGLEDIKAEGGITFAQEPSTAKFDGMPRSAIDSGTVDFVLPPGEMAKELRRIQSHPYVRQKAPLKDGDKEETEAEAPPAKSEFAGLITQLRKSSGVDFSQYKPNTIHRRALRRMMILKLESLGEYAEYLKEHPDEGQKLYDDVLIPVTSFFRDFEAFEALKDQVYPAIVKDKSNKASIRIWAPGCSTGEETYSLAMTLLEFLGERASSFQVQLFGTDLNERGIQKARAGVYRESIADEISPERMQRFFVKVEEGYRVSKAVRDMCVFARQNLAVDPPFSQMNVVACRNLLIYMQQSLQKKVIPILHYALKPDGFLVLGSSESVSTFPDLFSAVDKKHRIYGKKAVTSRLHYDFLHSYHPGGIGMERPGQARKAPAPAMSEFDAPAAADRLVLQDHAPVGVVIDKSMEVVQFRGRTSPYLEQAHGKPSLNLLKLARNGLGVQLRALVATAVKGDTAAKKEGVAFGEDGQKRVLNLSVTPLGGKEERERRCFLVLFEDVTPQWTPGPERAASRGRAKDGADKREIKRLRHEFSLAQDALRSAIESEDSLKEEFQSANEEIVSANEELQSTNEELETSKEELQSANEELNTLNSELHHKNVELRDLSNDLSNLLNSTRIPVVMLDRQLHIRRMTPAAHRLLNVRPSDVGRPLADIRSNIDAPGLEKMIAKVLDDLKPIEREVRDRDGHWHALSILPYQTQDNKIDGAVLALQDIDATKKAGEEQKRAAEFFRGVVDTVREPLLALNGDLKVVMASRAFLEMFKLPAGETINRFLYDLGRGQWNIPELRKLLEQVLPERKNVTDFRMENDFAGVGRKFLLLNARTLVEAEGRGPMILLAMEDATERKQAEAALIKSEKLAASGRLAATLAHEINNPLQAVVNLMDLLRKAEGLNEQERGYAAMAGEELLRVARLTQQSLRFYRETTAPEAINLEEKLESILELYSKPIQDKKIEVERRFKPGGSIVHSYRGELRQVFTTLLVNAVEAVPPGGKIIIRVRKGRGMKGLAPGVWIVFADNGMGIPARDAGKIFEAFFTTKGERGSGLGLWVARGILDRLGGEIRVRSSVREGGSGTCFAVFLPEQLPAK